MEKLLVATSDVSPACVVMKEFRDRLTTFVAIVGMFIVLMRQDI